MSFIIYDLIFMFLSIILVVIFLYTRKKNLKRQGILYLYHTKVGIVFIEYVSKKFRKILKPLQYVVITCGYILMAAIVWVLVKFVYIYLSSPTIAKDLKVPVLMPLVPYLPELFKITYLPPFYFTYWIIIIAVIAIPHEFAHGIFARINKIKIHSTGFGFLGPFLAAFVEPDEKKMAKSPKFAQLSVLAAGTFANIIVTIFFILVMWIFFLGAFHPIGIQFDSYSLTMINTSDINEINGVQIENLQNQSLIINPNEKLMNLTVGNARYFIPPAVLQQSISQGRQIILVYDDSPALREGLSGTIFEANRNNISSQNKLKQIIESSKPGDVVNIKTKQDNGSIKEYNIPLAEKDGKAFLGIGSSAIEQKTSLLGNYRTKFIELSDPLSYQKYLNNLVYESYFGDLGIFIYYLIWWLILVNLSVALMNMIPMGVFDGGRFFLLTVAGLTKSDKVGEWAYKISTWAILALVAALMAKWVFAVF